MAQIEMSHFPMDDLTFAFTSPREYGVFSPVSDGLPKYDFGFGDKQLPPLKPAADDGHPGQLSPGASAFVDDLFTDFNLDSVIQFPPHEEKIDPWDDQQFPEVAPPVPAHTKRKHLELEPVHIPQPQPKKQKKTKKGRRLEAVQAALAQTTDVVSGPFCFLPPRPILVKDPVKCKCGKLFMNPAFLVAHEQRADHGTPAVPDIPQAKALINELGVQAAWSIRPSNPEQAAGLSKLVALEQMLGFA